MIILLNSKKNPYICEAEISQEKFHFCEWLCFFNPYQLIMKKIFKLLLLIMTALSSCQKEEIVVPKPQQKPAAKPEKPQEPEKAWVVHKKWNSCFRALKIYHIGYKNFILKMFYTQYGIMCDMFFYICTWTDIIIGMNSLSITLTYSHT